MDIRVIQLTDILPIHKIEKTALQTPSLKITGEGFLTAMSVTINNVNSPDFAILSDTVIICQIPKLNERISNVVVQGRNATNTKRDSIIKIGLTDSIGITEGMSKLVQSFIKILLTRKGSSAFDPEMGSRFRDLMGMSINDNEVLEPLINQTITDVEQYILDTQSSALPVDERLLKVQITDIQYNLKEQGVSVSVMIYNANNQAVGTNIEV
jgi:hypothetical protein